MTQPTDWLATLQAVNQTAALHRWCGIHVLRVAPGEADVGLAWRPDLGQHTGFLHAGLMGAMIETACGYAAATLVGQVVASHYAVNCLRPAVGDSFVARARVVKPGKQQTFAACELYAVKDGKETLVATGDTLLLAVSA